MGIGSPTALVVPTLGASGAVYGVLLAYSLTWPDRTIMLIFPPVAFRAIWLIPVLFFMTILFGGMERLLFNGSPSDCVARHTVGTLTLWPKASANSASVMSGV